MEFVYVVKRYDLFDLEFPHGFVARAEHQPIVTRYLERITARGFFVERRHAEQDSSFKQVIPYVVVARGDEVLLLRRMRSQGESRLHDKLSIGVGGHINPIDAGPDVVTRAMQRELEEELHLSRQPPIAPAGILNDDSNAVGSVHFGLVAVADARSVDVAIRENDRMTGAFVDIAELKSLARDPANNFETWSALLVERIDQLVRMVD
ncbi:MAG: NUDIX domain-containing protein [Planctomycetota bacterium]